MTTVLVAEADPRVSSTIRRGLHGEGFATIAVGDGISALAAARRGDVDVIVLDAGLPGMDGLRARRLRAHGCALPVVVVAAQSRVAEALGQLTGATALVSTPLRLADLLAAVRRHLTRRPPEEPAELCYGGLRLDLRTRRAHVGDYCVDLSSRECALAETFLRQPGQVLTRHHLLRHVWGDDEPESNVVDVYVRYLRRKLGAHWFVAARGVGYRLAAAPC